MLRRWWLLWRGKLVETVARDVAAMMDAALRHDHDEVLRLVRRTPDKGSALACFIGAFETAFVPDPGEDDELHATLIALWEMVRDRTLAEVTGEQAPDPEPAS